MRQLADRLAQIVRQSGVLLDRDHMSNARDQMRGERPGAGADLDHDVVGLQMAMLGDARGQLFAHEEVLAPALARRQSPGGKRLLEAGKLAALPGGALAHEARRFAAHARGRARAAGCTVAGRHGWERRDVTIIVPPRSATGTARARSRSWRAPPPRGSSRAERP